MRAKEVRILVRDKRALKSTKMDHLPTANPLPTTNFQSTVRNSHGVVAFIPHVGNEQMGGSLHHSQNEKEAFASSTPRKINSLGHHHRMQALPPFAIPKIPEKLGSPDDATRRSATTLIHDGLRRRCLRCAAHSTDVTRNYTRDTGRYEREREKRTVA